MDTLVFVDTDILFSFFALNKEKMKKFQTKGSSGSEELDKIISIVMDIEKNNKILCISEFSILELICTLKRLNSGPKIPEILTKIYEICDVLPINNQMIKLAWFIGSYYTIHSGDALHISFCLSNNINEVILKDKELIDALTNIKNSSIEELDRFFHNVSYAQGVPELIKRKYENIKKIKITKI